MKNKFLLLKLGLVIGISLVAIFFRFYQLGSVPVSPDWDEAALGYNAYSILKTGKDEYGNFLPLSIRSFDDYKPPLYTYLTVPSVAVFGLNAFSTRLPSAIMGVLAVIGVYFLTKELVKKWSKETVGFVPLISSLLLALSPWHIQFSRIAFEANTGITLNIWGVYFFLRSIGSKKFLPISAFIFGVALYAYHSERVFAPLLVLLLLMLYRKELFSAAFRKTIIASVVVGLVTVLPLTTVLFNKTAMMRLQGTSSFTDKTGLLERTIVKIEDDRGRGDTVGEFIDNRRFVFVKTIISGYLSHFSLKWLFLTGDNPRHHAPDMGLLYVWEFPLICLGIYSLCKDRSKERSTHLLFGWFIIAPIAAAPTTGLPHAIRTLVFLPTFQIFAAFGMVKLFTWYKTSSLPKLIPVVTLSLYVAFILFNVFYYFSMYFMRMNREYSQYWQYGYEEAVKYTESVKGKYEKIVVSTGLEQSYMFYLFYTKFDPKDYLKRGGTKSGGFAENRNSFDRYVFRPLDWKNEVFDGKTLYVGSPSEMPHGNNAHIQFLNGEPAIEIKDRKD